METEEQQTQTEEESFEFSTVREVQPIKIDGEDYEVREMTAAARTVYLKALGKTMEVQMVGTGEKDSKGKEVMRKQIKVTDLSGAQKELLTATVFRVAPDGSRTKVPLTQVDSWGGRLVERLTKLASKLNGLEQPEDVLTKEAEKN